ncbi:hypothetical protein [Streptomyces sp. NPDC014676]|uniref:hypothetical protein n=1 Tax=Streptomyces sp. NPDC014676 TaxID=3364879 RepID=UPI0036F91AC5
MRCPSGQPRPDNRPSPEATGPLARRSLMEAAARFGRRRAYGDTTQVDALFTEQTETACTEAADHAQLATAKNAGVLTVQP